MQIFRVLFLCEKKKNYEDVQIYIIVPLIRHEFWFDDLSLCLNKTF